MSFNILLLVWVFVQLSLCAGEQSNRKVYFRKDYTFLEETQSYYKIHTIQRNWQDAKKICALEGGSLFYPEDQNEANVVREFWNETQPFSVIFIGVSDLLSKGIYESIDGHAISDIYNKWKPGEPNNANGNEDCATLMMNGNLNDVPCFFTYPFICKKSISTVEWNEHCDMPFIDYEFNYTLGKCYKFHNRFPVSWSDAFAACSAEQSYLAVPNSRLEANYLLDLVNRTPVRYTGSYKSEYLFVGIHNKLEEGWQTVKGEAVQESGYTRWSDRKLDGGDDAGCGAMTCDGFLESLDCKQREFFVCEHDIEKLRSSLNERRNEGGHLVNSTVFGTD